MNKSSWLLLTHQLPAKPSNIRVRVWRKLQDLGAVPVKNSLYVLPNNPETREDFEWLRKEIIQMKGEASVFQADTLGRKEDKDIIESFQEARSRDFAAWTEEAAKLDERIKSLLEIGHIKEESLVILDREWGKRLGEWERLVKIDFFGAAHRGKAEALAASLKKQMARAKTLSLRETPADPPPVEGGGLKGRLWVTRRSPKVDRLASAWLVRRFVDAKARFKFVLEPYKPRKGELRFDMYEGEFTHFGDWCTFETLIHRLSLKDPALTPLAEIIHDIDLKDGKFSRPEAAGVSVLIAGLCGVHQDDFKRLEAGMALFDALYGAFKAGPVVSGEKA